MTTQQAPVLLPTLPGFVTGIVGVDPLVLQCHDCGVTTTRTERTAAAGIILSGFHFHICEGRSGVRRCPACLSAVRAGCDREHCRRQAS